MKLFFWVYALPAGVDYDDTPSVWCHTASLRLFVAAGRNVIGM
jgi:hypothetical protein